MSYEILLQILERYFAHTEETDAQLGTLASAAVTLMGGVLRPLGDLITTLPVGSEHPGFTAGPSLELTGWRRERARAGRACAHRGRGIARSALRGLGGHESLCDRHG